MFFIEKSLTSVCDRLPLTCAISANAEEMHELQKKTSFKV